MMIQTMNLMTTSKIAIIITAAGSSTRIGGGIKKEFLPYKNGTVLSASAKSFFKACKNHIITDFIITTQKNGIDESKNAIFCDSELCSLLEQNKNLSIKFVEGGSSRQESVFKGLLQVQNSDDDLIVLIHDGARPFVTEQTILDVICAAQEFGASVPGVTPSDTQKEIDSNGFITRHLERNSLSAVQTPQGFVFNPLLQAHKKAIQDNKEYTDDTEIWGKYCGNVKVVPGDINNIKITYNKDLDKLK